MCLIAAIEISTVLYWVGIVLKVAIALGAVIFVHELGHYLVALACGVKIEKFMIGFDFGGLKLSRRWGETEYGIGVFPLGGYVKFLGQDDDPAHIAEQMQKSQVSADSANAVEVIGPSGEKYFVDRRSYLAKSVPQRMAIISAGVIMNVIFAFIFATIAYGMGVPYLPCIVSETVAGSPAWKAGLESGDEIIQIGDRVNPTFMQLMGGVTLADLEEGVHCEVRRAADAKVISVTLRPETESGPLARIGVGGPLSLELRKKLPVLDDSPAKRAKLVGTGATQDNAESKLKSGDEIIRVGDVPVANYREFAAELARHPDNPLLITVRRPLKASDNDGATAEDARTRESQELTFEIPPQPLPHFGLVMKMGPIAAVRANTPAAKAGLIEGDVIESIDSRPIAGGEGNEAQDPLAIPEYFRVAAEAAREIELQVRRPSGQGTNQELLTFRITPIVPTVLHSDIPIGAPVAVEAIGIAYHVENEVQSIQEGSAAAATDIAPGDLITDAKIILPRDENDKKRKPIPIELGPDHANWPALVDNLKFVPDDTQVEFKLNRGKDSEPRTVKMRPQPMEGIFVAPRGFVFEPITRVRKADTFAAQVEYGWDETVESLTMVFRFLRKLGSQVPITMLGGPGTIAVVAGDAASQGTSSLLIFLTMLSANLAVINFLPIPLLDGGHLVFLIYEGIRGRPASQRIVLALHTAGFVFIICLMIFVIGLDIHRWLSPLFGLVT